ncbi:nuclear transport factor 2 family protein [Roseisolibacter sp. H3M3-2]|uniref:nuclear transport factor 2 family protein n=1 Tax=Roseisolibacter sp. H3M3-2 TaxID=3031323 RepID=UPI0023D9FFEF|nr:nuclear transport factor 2 family protein [Roseisolibacter sp. H3M3-2]MDF1502367.1 nuclear transport factor 2 family protein [Roseisolibacter sp. H3M3-2]
MTTTADPAETHRVVDAFLGRLAVGDLPGLAALFADDVDWRLSWPEAELGGPVPWIRARRTPDGVLEHFRLLAAHNVPHGAGTRVEHVLVDGAHAVVLGTIRNAIRHTGAPYAAHFALHLTVEGGRVRRYHVYEDSLSVARAWEGVG